jgi:23S rRNA (adenine2503-C2)-methyltransferase
MLPFHSLTLSALSEWLASQDEKPYRAKQIFQWVYERKVADWESMTDLNKALRQKLTEAFSLTTLINTRVQHSVDEETTKFLWELGDGKLVESVLICSGDRRTVCVSSQVGCPARCAFCASGKEGLIRNLSAAEIFEQVVQIDRFLHEKGERVSHIVFMGMGEPFENYDQVLAAIHLIIDPMRLNISQRRITVSTVGVVQGIRRLMEEGLKLNLVLSLHAPNQHIRKKIIPYARKYELEDILAAMLEYSRQTHRDITYEYTLIQGINDREEHAEELCRLLKRQQCTVNLIPYNPVPGLRLSRPDKDKIESFKQILTDAGIVTTWRYTKGKDIAAACGQLALQEKSFSLSVLN